ncbi:hypothetical protein LQZ21_08240 [Treponema sp. TIM-1]|uniref:hypothetical protein n=1 Tax=Treponema sp. TIM-1 TaxID=2898417 RepID=UPI003980BDEC
MVRGSIADEAGLSKHDPISIRGFRVEEDAGIALLDINVKNAGWDTWKPPCDFRLCWIPRTRCKH